MCPMISQRLSLYFKGKHCCASATVLILYVILYGTGRWFCYFLRNGWNIEFWNLTNNFSFRSAILGEVQTRGSTKLPSYKSVVVLGEFFIILFSIVCFTFTFMLGVGGGGAEHYKVHLIWYITIIEAEMYWNEGTPIKWRDFIIGMKFCC
jgi:hypothetical protein